MNADSVKVVDGACETTKLMIMLTASACAQTGQTQMSKFYISSKFSCSSFSSVVALRYAARNDSAKGHRNGFVG